MTDIKVPERKEQPEQAQRREHQERRKSGLLIRAKLKLWLFVFSALFVLLTIWSFVRELRLVRSQPINSWTEDHIADCAVVLTGGASRVREGFDLLARKSVQKLIVSGVHPQAELRDIFPLWPYYGDLHEQDVILEKRSRTTFGNAQQSLSLVEAMRCRDIVLVTSRLHMYRALRTFQAEFPQRLRIYPRAIVGGPSEAGTLDLGLEVVKSLFYSTWAY